MFYSATYLRPEPTPFWIRREDLWLANIRLLVPPKDVSPVGMHDIHSIGMNDFHSWNE